MLDKCRLHWVKLAGLSDSFDGRDHIVLVHRCKGQARIHSAPVDMHRASTALAMVAPLLRACQLQGFTKTIQQRCSSVDPDAVLLAIDIQTDPNQTRKHRVPPLGSPLAEGALARVKGSP